MSLELYRIERGSHGLRRLAENGGWGTVPNFLKQVHILEVTASSNYVWWITEVASISTLNEVPDELVEERKDMNVCLIAPSFEGRDRWGILEKLPAFRIEQKWYIAESSFDKAMGDCFGDYKWYLPETEKKP